MAICHKCERDLELLICKKCEGKLRMYAFCKSCMVTHRARHKFIDRNN